MSEDTLELQALFDNIAQSSRRIGGLASPPAAAPAAAEVAAGRSKDAVFERVGQLTRMLHDALQELGYDRVLEDTLQSIPGARDRLAYVARTTEQAARRVLDATDVASPLQEAMAGDTAVLGQRWDRVLAGHDDVAEFRRLVLETRAYLKETAPARIAATRAQLNEIMLAQDFQDLTGQVIRRIADMAKNLEDGLLQLLIEVMPERHRTREVDSLLNGPVVNAQGRSDVVANQQQVDDLLATLGF